jgi:carbon monoxide dehydrogenase subunit G
MRISYRGEFEVNLDKDKTFRSLIDIEKVGNAFPGVEKIEKIDEKNVHVRVRLGIGALKGVLNIKLGSQR